MIGAKTENLDLDQMLEQVQKGSKNLAWAVMRGKNDLKGQHVRLTSLISCSASFRQAILDMRINEPLCILIESIFSEIFTEDEIRKILLECKQISKEPGEILFRADDSERKRYWTYVIEGDVTITRTLDEEEVSQNKSVENSFFGAYKFLNTAFRSSSVQASEEEKETPVKEGGSGVNNTIVRAVSPVKIMQMRLSSLLNILQVKGPKYQALLLSTLLDSPTRDLQIPLISFKREWERHKHSIGGFSLSHAHVPFLSLRHAREHSSFISNSFSLPPSLPPSLPLFVSPSLPLPPSPSFSW